MRCRAVNSSIYFTSISELDGVMSLSGSPNKNRVNVTLCVDESCNMRNEVCTLILNSSLKPIEINGADLYDDIALINECVANCLDELPLIENGFIEMILEDDGEWEGFAFHRYFTLISAKVVS